MAAPAPAAPFTGSIEFCATMDANDAAMHRFETLPESMEIDDEEAFKREEELVLAAGRAADQATPANWQEFTHLLRQMCDNGLSDTGGENAARLLTHAQRILALGGVA